MKKQILTFDIETYQNYFLILLRNIITGELRHFQMFNDEQSGVQLKELFNQHETYISFNGVGYDIPMIVYLANNPNTSNQDLKGVSDAIITSNQPSWATCKQLGINKNMFTATFDHIDVMNIAPDRHSLKLYGARLGSKKLQELPYKPDAYVDDNMAVNLFNYCINDNIVTADIYNEVLPAIKRREGISKELQLDVRSLSDVQVGEKLILRRIEGKTLQRIYKSKEPLTRCSDFQFDCPDFIEFKTPILQEILDTAKSIMFEVNQSTFKVALPKELSKVLTVGRKKYKMGIGGLHSKGDHHTHHTTESHTVVQIDVRSYYPNTIINNRIHPRHIPEGVFLDVYSNLLKSRDDAKLELKTATDPTRIEDLETIIAGVKLALNGYYGKVASDHSPFFDPRCLIQTTLIGQLCLLMLLEKLESFPTIEILSANTDGITIRHEKQVGALVKFIVSQWEKTTGYMMDYDYYRSISYRDVNNYGYITDSGKQGGIGVFKNQSLRYSPNNLIIRDAVLAYLDNKTPFNVTINKCKDVHRFITVANVTGGAMRNGVAIGKIIRFYHSLNNTTPILRVKPNSKDNHNMVANTMGAMPLMDYSDDNAIPDDLDRWWYIKESYRLSVFCGIIKPDNVMVETLGITKQELKKYEVEIINDESTTYSDTQEKTTT